VFGSNHITPFIFICVLNEGFICIRLMAYVNAVYSKPNHANGQLIDLVNYQETTANKINNQPKLSHFPRRLDFYLHFKIFATVMPI
jgi:hypothetical protein